LDLRLGRSEVIHGYYWKRLFCWSLTNKQAVLWQLVGWLRWSLSNCHSHWNYFRREQPVKKKKQIKFIALQKNHAFCQRMEKF